jgi:glc operon protein GlcG
MSGKKLCAALAGTLFAMSVRAEGPSPRILDVALAESMLSQCVEKSSAKSWPPFTIAFVDSGGTLILLKRQNGASPVTADAAVVKARTAVRIGIPTQSLIALSQDAPNRDLLIMLQMTDDPGGVPLRLSGIVVGAIGVSGGTAEQDTGCAAAATAQLTAKTQ